eukprot:g14434.t1
MASPNRRAQRIQGRRLAPPARVNPLHLARMLRRRKLAGLIVVLLIIVSISVLDRRIGVLPVDDDWHRYHGQSFEVARVIDGDTLVLPVPDGDEPTTHVRLWGVDTPEMNRQHPDRPPEPLAQDATDFTQSVTKNQRVTLHLQSHRLRGGFGRLLAYVELPDGTDLNARLIKEGLSEHDDRWSHDRAELYGILEQQARENRRGVWDR